MGEITVATFTGSVTIPDDEKMSDDATADVAAGEAIDVALVTPNICVLQLLVVLRCCLQATQTTTDITNISRSAARGVFSCGGMVSTIVLTNLF